MSFNEVLSMPKLCFIVCFMVDSKNDSSEYKQDDA